MPKRKQSTKQATKEPTEADLVQAKKQMRLERKVLGLKPSAKEYWLSGLCDEQRTILLEKVYQEMDIENDDDDEVGWVMIFS